MSSSPTGFVSIVGAGPGDPDLLTVRAARRIAEADVILHDNLVSPEILALARPDARRVSVAKIPGAHSVSQEVIHGLLIKEARSGLRVLRLKGGDPFVFGRGGEEARALHAAGIPFEVVPGISSAIAAPAAAGIPVTHRGVATSFSVVTGFAAGEEASLADTWAHLARAGGTLVVLMGVAQLDRIATSLQEAGVPGDRPAAVVQAGTCPHQRTVTATLRDIAARVREADLAAPATLVIGDVVALREVLGAARPESTPVSTSATRVAAAG